MWRLVEFVLEDPMAEVVLPIPERRKGTPRLAATGYPSKRYPKPRTLTK
jgi:hypothetical protein